MTNQTRPSFALKRATHLPKDRPVYSMSRWWKGLSAACVGLALIGLSAGRMQGQTVTTSTFNTVGNATWVCPNGVTSGTIEAWGGGGGGGGCGEQYTLGGGGAGGSYVRFATSLTSGTYQLTVGAGGAGGTGGGGVVGNGGTGGTGGSSFFGNTVAGGTTGALGLAVGGPGGAANNNTSGHSTSTYTGSIGGVGTNSGNFIVSGSIYNFAGTSGLTPVGGSVKLSGSGGQGAGPTGSAGGGWGGGGETTALATGSSGFVPGGGGGGGIQVTSANNGAGGVGGGGQIVLTYLVPAAPTINVSGTPTSTISGTYGTASATTGFSVSGTNLTNNIVATAPTGFEISTSSNASFSGSVTLVESGSTVSSTPLYVRLAATTGTGVYSGNVNLVSTGANPVGVPMQSSTVSALALTVTGAAVTTKPWDGTTAATITGTLVGIVGSDQVTLIGTGTYASASDGTGIAVGSTSTLSGVNAGNYTLVQPTGLTGTILASANLGNVTLGTSSMTPAFAFGTMGYSVGVSNSVSNITLEHFLFNLSQDMI